jgi:hypothetical protein
MVKQERLLSLVSKAAAECICSSSFFLPSWKSSLEKGNYSVKDSDILAAPLVGGLPVSISKSTRYFS